MLDHTCAENSPSSPDLPHRGIESQGGLSRDDGQLVVPVVIYQVDHAVECSVPGPAQRKLQITMIVGHE